MTEPVWLTIADTAEATHTSIRTIWRLIEENRIEPIQRRGKRAHYVNLEATKKALLTRHAEQDARKSLADLAQ